MTVIDPRIMEREKTKRLQAIEEVIKSLDDSISTDADGSADKSEMLTQVAATVLIRKAMNLAETTVYYGAKGCVFSQYASSDIDQTIAKCGIESDVVVNWIVMQVALRFVERVANSATAKLEERDRNE